MENIVLPEVKSEILDEHEPINSFLEVKLETSSPVFEASFIETDNKTLKYKCPMCSKKFKSKEKVQSHVNSHITVHSIYSNGNFKCSECNCYFDSKEILQIHIETHKKNRGRPRKDSVSSDDDVKPYICDKCAKGFRRKQQLLNHSLIHYDIKPFQCDQCEKSFKLKQQLQNHSKVHEDVRPFICENCEKSFKFKQQLENHSKTHTDIRPFKCIFCEKAFKFKQQLQNHCRVHDDLRPFKCDFCEKAFKLKQQLQFHNKVHSDERPFQCFTCEKSFKFKQQLKNHYKVHSKMFIESSILEPSINLETMDVSNSSLLCEENEKFFNSEKQVCNDNLIPQDEMQQIVQKKSLDKKNVSKNVSDLEKQINDDLIPSDESTENSIVENSKLAMELNLEDKNNPSKQNQDLLKNHFEKKCIYNLMEQINKDNIMPTTDESSKQSNIESEKLGMEINLDDHSLKQNKELLKNQLEKNSVSNFDEQVNNSNIIPKDDLRENRIIESRKFHIETNLNHEYNSLIQNEDPLKNHLEKNNASGFEEQISNDNLTQSDGSI